MAPPPPPPHHHRASAAGLQKFVDRARLDRLLAPWVPDAADRAFVLRCLLDEGPAHHRGANWVLLVLLGEALGQRPAAPAAGERVEVAMRLPPHLAREVKEGNYPLGFPVEVLDRLAPRGSPEQTAMIECLTDGPPQHALANAAMVCLLSALLAAKEPPA